MHPFCGVGLVASKTTLLGRVGPSLIGLVVSTSFRHVHRVPGQHLRGGGARQSVPSGGRYEFRPPAGRVSHLDADPDGQGDVVGIATLVRSSHENLVCERRQALGVIGAPVAPGVDCRCPGH